MDGEPTPLAEESPLTYSFSQFNGARFARETGKAQ
jgi:hypothetical protein